MSGWSASRLSLLLGAALVAGVLRAESTATSRLAFVPVDVVGLPPAQGQALQRALDAEIERSPRVELVPAAALQEALAQQGAALADCHADQACLVAVGRAVDAELVLAVDLAGLGSTRVVRCRLLQVEEGLLLQDLQETVVGEQAAFAPLAAKLVQRLFPAEPTPWFRQWWFWTAAAVGAAAVVAAITVTAIVLGRQEPAADVVHVGDL